MNGASNELAVTRQVEAIGVGGRRRNDNLIIWVIIIIFFLCFCNGDGFGLGNLGGGYDPDRHHHHHHHRRRGNTNNFFGENGWFILIIFAVLFLFNDGFGGANTNIINVDADDDGTC